MSSPLIIAEAGVNHNGERGRALELVRAAATAGADIVKFQAFTAASLAAADAPTAAYQARNTSVTDQQKLLASLELTLEDFGAVAAECRHVGVEFLCTPFDSNMTAPLIELGMRRIKVASGEITNFPALRHFASFGIPLIVSTGMSALAEVDAALSTVRAAGATDVTLLHCTSLYPAPLASVNLRAMTTMQAHCGAPVGYSDHTLGDEVALAATALGATVIEKHLTLDRRLPGPDHAASLEPQEFSAMVGKIRSVAQALGSADKKPNAHELEIVRLVRRSWHAARDLPASVVLSAADLVLKRPNDGVSPTVEIAGRRLARAVSADAPIRSDDLV